MEMPEGWKRQKRYVRDFWFPSEDGHLDLMKEMAESLEEASYRMKPCSPDEIDIVNDTLKKFKEWK